MKKQIKKSYIVIDVLLSVFLVVLLTNLLILKNSNYLLLSVMTFITFGILMIRYGFEVKNKRFTYETMFYSFAYTIVYLIIIYMLGLFTGFTRSIYSLNIYNLIHNIIPYILLIISGELLRSEVVRKAENSVIAYTLITIAMVVIDCTIYLTAFDLATGDGQIKYICYIMLPSISKNCLLLYIMKIGGHYPCLVYRAIMELRLFVVPIEPDFGMYLESVMLTVIPVIIGLGTFFSLKQYQNKEIEGKDYHKSKIYIYASVAIMFTIVATVVILTSCRFRYGMLSIGSGSMTGTINKGDAVIYEAIDKKKMPEKGDILVFRKEGRVIVHRIIKVVKVSKTEIVYYTKGDANKTEDGYPILEKDIIGIVKKRVKYIGMPSVALHELTKHESTL